MVQMTNGGFESGDFSLWYTGSSSPEHYSFSVQSSTVLFGTYAAYIEHYIEGATTSSGGATRYITKSENDRYLISYFKPGINDPIPGIYLYSTDFSTIKQTTDFSTEPIGEWTKYWCDISDIDNDIYILVIQFSKNGGIPVAPFDGIIDGCSIDRALSLQSCIYTVTGTTRFNRIQNSNFQTNDMYQWGCSATGGGNIYTQPSTLIANEDNICTITGGNLNTYINQTIDLTNVSKIWFYIRPTIEFVYSYVWVGVMVDDVSIYGATHPLSESFSKIEIDLNESYNGTHVIKWGVWEEV